MLRIPPSVLRWPSACLEAFEALLFPMSCLVCDVDGTSGPFCPDCRSELLGASEGACPRCALSCGPFAATAVADSRGRRPECAWCRGRALGFDAAMALGPYQGPIREACLRLKHASGAWLAVWLADLIAEAHGATLRAEADGRQAAPWVVPVPLHWMRHRQRGYNQAEALARRLASRFRWDFRRPLRRVVATRHLADLSRRERAEALRNAFQICGTPDLRGRTVVLVDDILTTGATSGAAARTLKRAGAARVVVVVVGRAEGTR